LRRPRRATRLLIVAARSLLRGSLVGGIETMRRSAWYVQNAAGDSLRDDSRSCGRNRRAAQQSGGGPHPSGVEPPDGHADVLFDEGDRHGSRPRLYVQSRIRLCDGAQSSRCALLAARGAAPGSHGRRRPLRPRPDAPRDRQRRRGRPRAGARPAAVVALCGAGSANRRVEDAGASWAGAPSHGS
jgi:hypothetical protein